MYIAFLPHDPPTLLQSVPHALQSWSLRHWFVRHVKSVLAQELHFRLDTQFSQLSVNKMGGQFFEAALIVVAGAEELVVAGFVEDVDWDSSIQYAVNSRLLIELSV